jgi:hypothetical protein
MPRPPKSDLAKAWAKKIERAEEKHEEWMEQQRIKLARAYFSGQQNPGYPSEEWITINKIFANLGTQLPSLYSVDPYFYVKLKRSYSPHPMDIARYEEMAKVRSAYLNYLKEELGLWKTARLAVQDAFFAFGVVKIHFIANEIRNPQGGSAIMDEDGKPLMGEDGNGLVEPDFLLADERYAVTRVHPDDFLWDEDAGPLPDKWSWIGERVRLTKSQARNDRRIKRSVLEDIETEKRVEEDDESEEVYTLYELYDLKAKQWCIAAEDAHELVMDPRPLPPGVEGHPYAILRFTLQDASPYPIPTVSQALDPQKEYGLARSRILTHRKRFARKYLVYGPAFDDPDAVISKLAHGEDGTCLVTNAPGDAVRPIADAPLDQAGYLEVQALNNDIVEAFGVSDEARGVSGADSATQAAIIAGGMRVREGDKQALVGDWVRDIARKLDQLVQSHITRDEAVRVAGPRGEQWALIRTDDYAQIAGEFSYDISVGSTLPRLPEVEQTQLMGILGLLGQYPQFLLSRQLLKRVFELFRMDDELLLEQLLTIGQQLMSGALPMPGQGGAPGSGGSVAGVTEPAGLKGLLGAAMGALGGNAMGGGQSMAG